MNTLIFCVSMLCFVCMASLPLVHDAAIAEDDSDGCEVEEDHNL